MEANETLLQMKYARIIEQIAADLGISNVDAMDMFYNSRTFQLISQGIADLHCRSDRYLAELCGLYSQMTDEQRDFLQEIRPMNIEARYPDYKRSIANTLGEEKTRQIVEQTKQMQQWILQECSAAMRPSASSDDTSK